MVLDALFLCPFCTATTFVNTKTIIGPNQVGVNFCCGKDEELVVEGEPLVSLSQLTQARLRPSAFRLRTRRKDLLWMGGKFGLEEEMAMVGHEKSETLGGEECLMSGLLTALPDC